MILVGPFSQGVATIDFLGAAAAAADTSAFVYSVTGDHEVDKAAAVQCGQVSGRTVAVGTGVVPTPTTMIPVADADQEVHVVVREILRSAEQGAPFDRMAVFVPLREPYLRMVREHLDRSGIPSAGPDHRTLADSMTGRLLMTILDLVDAATTTPNVTQYDRDTVMGLVAAAPITGPDGKRIRSCLLYTSPSPRDRTRSRMPSSA